MLENLLIGIPANRDGSTAPAVWPSRRNRPPAWADARSRLPVSALSVGEQQRLENRQGAVSRARLLILDEPTAVLAPSVVDGLFSALRSMAAQGSASSSSRTSSTRCGR